MFKINIDNIPCLSHGAKKLFKYLNEETILHSLRVAQIAVMFANDLNISEKILYDCGLWHDAGKVYILDVISKTEELTDEEYEKIKTHPLRGLDFIEENYDGEHWYYVKLTTLFHHCRCDGTGYPQLKGFSNPPLIVQLVSIADCFEALTAERSYKKPFSAEKSKEMILNDKCGKFSNEAKEIFLKHYDKIVYLLFN